MSVYLISVRGGRKVALPVLTEESYRRLRNTSSQQANLRQARMGNQAAKRRLIQFNYSGYYPDGVVKGCRLPSQAFGFDVDDAGEFERIAKMLMEKRGPAMESQGTGDRREKRESSKKTRARKPGHFCRLRLPACCPSPIPRASAGEARHLPPSARFCPTWNPLPHWYPHISSALQAD